MQSLKPAAGHKPVDYFPHLSLKAMQAVAQQQYLPRTPDVCLLIIILLWWLRCFIEDRLFRRLVFIFNTHILRNKCLYYCSFSVTVGRVQRSNADIKHAQCLMCQCWAGPAPRPHHPQTSMCECAHWQLSTVYTTQFQTLIVPSLYVFKKSFVFSISSSCSNILMLSYKRLC